MAEKFEELLVWQSARVLTRQVYEITQDGRFARDFGLASQIQRASVSIMSNIAGGFERYGDGEFHQFLSIAKGSCAELRTQLYIAADIGYLTPDQFSELMRLADAVPIADRPSRHHRQTPPFLTVLQHLQHFLHSLLALAFTFQSTSELSTPQH